MKNESEIFIPTSLGTQKRRRYRHAPWLSTHLFNIFEQSPVYASLVFLAFTFAIYIGTLTTYEEHYAATVPALFYIELILFIYCLIEFILRIYASESRVRYHGLKGKCQFVFEHYLIIDFILLILYGIIFLWNFIKFHDRSILFLYGLRFLQSLRFISLDRHIKSIPLLSCIIWQYRRVLLAAVYLCFLLLLPTAYLLWIVEKSIQTKEEYFFKTYTDALWFTINSMATIGYGDTWPQTLIGRALTASLCCAGVVLWTLPAGIISAGLTSIDEKRRESERLRPPAARLILAWWRLQASNNQLQTVFAQHHEKAICKQVIARLLYTRLLREFQRCRYGIPVGYDAQTKKDIGRILHCLQIMGEKLSTMDQKFIRTDE